MCYYLHVRPHSTTAVSVEKMKLIKEFAKRNLLIIYVIILVTEGQGFLNQQYIADIEGYTFQLSVYVFHTVPLRTHARKSLIKSI